MGRVSRQIVLAEQLVVQAVHSAFHGSATPISSAAPMATASSIKAAGRSRPKADASRARNPRPPSVPMIAPIIPAMSPPIIDPIEAPAEAPTAAPDSPPVTIRAPNWIGTVRLGVDGSWSVTSSTRAKIVRIQRAQTLLKKASQVPLRSSQPRYAAQLTNAGAVMA